MQAQRTRRGRWTLLLGAGLAAVAIASLLTFATLARKTSLRDRPEGRIAVVEPGEAPEEINLPSPSPSGGGSAPTGDEGGSPASAPPVGAPDVDPTAAPTLAAHFERETTGSADHERSPRKDPKGGKSGKDDGSVADDEGPGRSFASSSDKPGKGPKAKAAKVHGDADHDKGPKSSHGHGSSHGKGHTKSRGKGHDKHGD